MFSIFSCPYWPLLLLWSICLYLYRVSSFLYHEMPHKSRVWWILNGSHWKALLKRKGTFSNGLLKQDSERYTTLWSNIADIPGSWDKSFSQKEFKEPTACNWLKRKFSCRVWKRRPHTALLLLWNDLLDGDEHWSWKAAARCWCVPSHGWF